ncbi:hypothetical protein V2J09_001675 [Rumex salicifolius]
MDENSKHGGDDGAAKLSSENAVVENPNSAMNAGNGAAAAAGDAAIGAAESGARPASGQVSSRTPFTNLSQVEADLALARTLQEQERAYMMLSMNGGSSNYGSWEEEYYYEGGDGDYDDLDGDEYDGIDEDQENDNERDINHLDDDDDSENDDEIEDNESDDDDEGDDDASDVHDSDDSGGSEVTAGEVDPSAYPDDEAYARALQDAEEREMAARLLAMAGITEREDEDLEDHGGNSQEAWEEVDPDELSYEELIALGEIVGTESRGLSDDTIASLPSINYKSENNQDEEPGTCVICRLEYEDNDALTLLTCKHSYHSECISNWLKINKKKT